jgi:predicted acyl esterase
VWCAFGLAGDFPSDQRSEDGLSLCFTSAPLPEPLEILGFPDVMLTVASDKPNALVAVRLCDVSPTGASTLVSRGMLNLTHRESHEAPAPLEPGTRYAVTVRLKPVAYSMPAGHRWRVAVSPTYWPFAWPSPEPATLSVFAGHACRLDLPVRPPRTEDVSLRPFAPPETAVPPAVEWLRPAARNRAIHRDLVSGLSEVVDRTDDGWYRLPTGTECENIKTDTFTIREGDPLSAQVR